MCITGKKFFLIPCAIDALFAQIAKLAQGSDMGEKAALLKVLAAVLDAYAAGGKVC